MGVSELQRYIPLRWEDQLQVAVLFVGIYLLLRLVKDTAAGSMLRGALTVTFAAVIAATFVIDMLELRVLGELLKHLLNALVFALLIVFQPELRRGLLSLGERRFFGSSSQREDCRHALSQAVATLARARHGALFAIERNNTLPSIVETGVTLDAEAKSELIRSIFWPDSPLHDGGVVIRGTRLVAAGCIFPLAERRDLASRFGTRHRAGLGMSEQSDAVVVIVSEETGTVSIAVEGTLTSLDDPSALLGELERLLHPEVAPGTKARGAEVVQAASDPQTGDDGAGDDPADGETDASDDDSDQGDEEKHP